MEKPKEWYLRRYAPLASVISVILGTWMAIILLPTVFLALAFFLLVAGPGIYIAYKQRNLVTIGFISIFPAWIYLFMMLIFARGYYALLFDLAIAFVLLIMLGISVLVWAALRKHAPNNGTLIAAKKPVLFSFFILLVVVPFIIGVPYDYNMRADNRPVETIRAKIVDKYIDIDDDGKRWPLMTFETLDEGLRFDYPVSWSYYNEHDLGHICQIWLHRGALGYPWIEGYVN